MTVTALEFGVDQLIIAQTNFDDLRVDIPEIPTLEEVVDQFERKFICL